jgi:phenylalanyl-tRNA synthetase alpha subunit
MPTASFVESGFWCFDALFVPQQHPARDLQDTFYISGKDFPGPFLFHDFDRDIFRPSPFSSSRERILQTGIDGTRTWWVRFHGLPRTLVARGDE